MTKFIPGLQLSEQFYKKIVKPLIETEFQDLKYSAGLIGSGSEVLGFDTEQSTDHHWGPCVMLFLLPKDISKKNRISDFLSRNLPPTFKGYSTNFGTPDEIGVQLLSKAEKGQPINHRIEMHTIKSFFKRYLQIDPNKNINVFDWLTFSEQKLRTIKYGKFFHDQLGLNYFKEKLNYFPKDVWLYLLASEWMKISQEEPFVGRTGDVDDELGSRIIAARLVQSIMRLCFLMEKEYAPYSKWFGTAFLRLKCAKKLSPVLEKVLASKKWTTREKHLSKSYKIIAQIHNDLKLTKPIKTEVSSFHGRPYLVIHGEIFANEIKNKIKDHTIKNIPSDIGSVNQLSNTVDLLENDSLLNRLKILYK
ncbi:DUF4037 domain-containing protein [bacterium]|nr:DUF4037 domain-containing protein [bacterium]